MYTPPPSPDTGEASAHLATFFTSGLDANPFRGKIRTLQRRFDQYAATSPAPFIAPGLVVTPEIRRQSELYLPIAAISSAFTHLYRAALSYPPIISSTPFYRPLSWADTFAELPPFMQFSTNPAHLLEQLLADRDLLTSFVCASFLPRRFYGGCGRYPEQLQFIHRWLEHRKNGPLRCLDAACGTGEETYGLALLLAESGFSPDEVRVEGWTVEPLEIWSATHRRLPHNLHRETRLRESTASFFQQGYARCLRFGCRDILAPLDREAGQDNRSAEENRFDLIICNGLLGGPIIHQEDLLDRAVAHLTALLAPGGLLLAADNFHAGWKQKCPQTALQAVMVKAGLSYVDTGEGVGGLKPDQQAAPG